MTVPYYQLLGHLVAAQAGFKKSVELKQLLGKGGFGKATLQKLDDLVDTAQKLIAERDEQHDDRIEAHALHAAATEVEMWMQTVEYRLRDLDEELRDVAMGAHIHVHDHTASVAAQADRLIAMIRCDDRVAQALGNPRQVHDTIARGLTLLKKMYKAGSIRLDPEDHEEPGIFDRIEQHKVAMNTWLAELDAACSVVAEKNVALLGILGYVPEGVGLPAGGMSFAVTLHQRSRHQAPDPSQAGPTSGWSIGRQQGRNNENLGKGWVDPTLK